MCTICGTLIHRRRRGTRPVCSEQCRRVLTHGAGAVLQPVDRDQEMVTRARRYGSPVIENVSSAAVFARDQWTCYLCGAAVSDQVDCMNPLAATIDHVVPLSAAGHHTTANCRTACFQCNSSK